MMNQQVLIIDDSPEIHTLVRARLRREPIRIASADGGGPGLEAARSLAPDLILLDVDMPGMNGFDVCARLKADEATRSIPVIFLTAAATTEQKLRGLELGAMDYIAKPFDPAELKARVMSALRSERLMALERRRSRVLEMITADHPLSDILLVLVEMAERSFPGACASAAVRTGGRLEQVAPSLPDDFKTAAQEQWAALSARGLAAVAEGTITCGNPAADAQWPNVQAAAAKHNLTTCWSVPIRPASGAGTFCVYLRGPAELDEEARSLLRAIARLATIASQHRELTHQLAHMAHHDPLTGLPNRVLFEDRLNQALARTARAGMTALFCIDLDRFKNVNDTLGHDAGDAVLKEFSRRAAQLIRPSDTLARVGGDEFLLVLGDIESKAEAQAVGQRLMEALAAPFEVGQNTVTLTASIGLAVSPEHGASAADLEKKADVAMYRAKSRGRNGCECFTAEMLSSADERVALEANLRHAVRDRELVLHYQPQFDAADRLIGFEAMVRWQHPKLGLLPPGRFISLAEETGLIIGIGAWVIDEACRQNRAWQLAGHAPVKVAVNVSAIQLERPDFVGVVVAALRRHELEPRWLELELTESLMMKANPDTIQRLVELRAMGIGISLDDFGTGHSSLSYLHRLPVDCIKMDRSFISRVNANAGDVDSTAVLRAVLSLGHSLGMKVLAEGVEERHQLESIQRLGFDAVQGFYRGRPVPPTQVEGLLRDAERSPQITPSLPLSA